jgi:hypothetical protein
MFLPIIALAPALPTILSHFKDVPNAKTVAPILLTVPALCIAIFGCIAGWLTDRFGRRPPAIADRIVVSHASLSFNTRNVKSSYCAAPAHRAPCPHAPQQVRANLFRQQVRGGGQRLLQTFFAELFAATPWSIVASNRVQRAGQS